MIARLAGPFAASALIMGAALGPVPEATPARALQAASRLVRDGDLQADWNKLLDARARLEELVHHKNIAALVHYQLGYLEWRMSALVYMSSGYRGQVPHWRRAVAELEQAVALQPDLADAHALIGLCTTALLSTDPGQAERLRPRIDSAWKSALDPARTSPRAMLLRAMSVFATSPASGGSQTRGVELWREAIGQLERESVADPRGGEWGLAEAWGWLGGAYLMLGEHENAVPAFERALGLRRDFWWVSRVAMPQAKRPAAPPASAGQMRGSLERIGVPSVVIDWAATLWATIAALVQTALHAHAP
jgi:tetratricopeptide (TPR) repeat protein